MSEEVWTLVQSLIASSLTNINSSKSRPASLDKRSEGWTEVFGNLACAEARRDHGDCSGKEEEDVAGGDADTKHDGGGTDRWMAEDEFVRRTLETSNGTTFYDNMVIQNTNDGDLPVLRLSQYRVAWREQLLLRIIGLPHLVTNSSYASTESVGALPSLMDTDNGALVGRQTSASSSSVCCSDNNGIVDYLLTSNPNHMSRFADAEFTPEQQRQSRWCTGLLRNELDTVLCCLRYACTEAWRDVHRPRAVRASVDPNGRMDLHRLSSLDTSNETSFWKRFCASINGGSGIDDDDDDADDTVGSGFFHTSAWFQAWSERAVHKKRLALSDPYRLFPQGSGEVDIKRALALAKDSYDIIESMMVQITSSEQSHDDPNDKNGTDGVDDIVYRLFGTEKPSLAEPILFEHLAEALCDLNLVSVLKNYPRLIGFFQTTYRTYFGASYIQHYHPSHQSTSDSASKDNEHNSWIRHNNRYNLLNRFHRLPTIPPSRNLLLTRTDTSEASGTNGKPQPKSSSSSTTINYNEVVPIIRSLAVHCRDYRQLLVDVAALRDEERTFRDKHCSEGGGPWGLLNRWRMGGSMSLEDDQSNTKNDGDNGNHRNGTDTSEGGGGRRDRDDGTDAFTKRNQKHVRDLKRQAKTQDELWISGVTVGTLFGLVLAVAKSSSSVAIENS